MSKFITILLHHRVPKKEIVEKSFELMPTLGIALTVIGLFYAGRQFQLSRRLAKHQFVFQLFDKMDAHNELHEKVTKVISSNEDWPLLHSDWIMVGRLLGLYENIGHLVDDKIMTIEQADSSFSYRLVTLLKIEKIRQFIFSNSESWKNLKVLIDKLEKQEVYKALSSQSLSFPE